MKLAMENYFPRLYLGEEEACRLIKETGFDGVDYSFFWMTPEYTVLGADYLEHAARAKALLQAYGLVCNQAHAPFGFQYGNPTDCSDPVYLSIVRAMEFASILGARHIVVHAIHVPDGTDCLAYNIAYYQSLEPYCRKFGIRIAVENLKNSLNTPELHNGVLEALDPQWFCGLVDVGHAILCGYTAQDYIRSMLPGRLQGLHVHDNFGHKDDHMIPGIGVIEWDAVIEALADISYAGDFTLEIIFFLSSYGPELLNETLRMSYAAGRYFADKLEAAKRERA